MNDLFHKIAVKISTFAGNSKAFVLALSLVVVWALTGKFFNYSESWQLFINTITTIVTFLMVFLIQNTQNRDSRAMHLKLDELIKAHRSADDHLLDIEDVTDAELDELAAKYKALHDKLVEKKTKVKSK